MAKRGGRLRRAARRAYRGARRVFRRGKSEPKYRVVPLTFAVKAASEPLLTWNPNYNCQPFGQMLGAWKLGDWNSVAYGAEALIDNVGNVIPQMVIDGAAAGVSAWAGRKFKLMKATRVSKDVSIF